MSNRKLTLRSLPATAVTLPMKRPLGTSAKSIDNACLLLVDLLTQDGIEGRTYRHMALIAQAAKTPIQIGENFTGLPPMAAALAAGASDYVMLDLDRIGGVTGWQRAAGLAAAYNREVSSHLFPEVSAHLLAATPGRHWLEYVDWTNSILQESIQIRDGMAIIPSRASNGLSWNTDVVAKYRLD